MYDVLSKELEKANVPKAPKAILAGGFAGGQYFLLYQKKMLRKGDLSKEVVYTK